MRCLYWAIALLILLPTVQYGSSSSIPANHLAALETSRLTVEGGGPGSGGWPPALIIFAIMPSFPSEGIWVLNSGDLVISLKGWSLSDQEGSLDIVQDIYLAPGEKVAVCSDAEVAQRLAGDERIIGYGSESLIKRGRFQLADEGDEVMLLDPLARCCDLVVYGKSDYAGNGWIGKPCAKVPEGKQLRRANGPCTDTNTSADWSLAIPGMSYLPPLTTNTRVEPFLSPHQMRGRIVRELNFAQVSVKAAVYELTDDYVVKALADCSARGVEVQILLEGQPVSGISEHEGQAIGELQDSGCDILLLKTFHGYKRFPFMHAKYMVLDGQRTLVCSENWATSSLDDNRGWGALIEGAPIADYYSKVFENDHDQDRLDASLPPSSFPKNGTFPLAPLPGEEAIQSYQAQVKAILSPDNSLAAVREMLASAHERVLLELFYWDDLADSLSLRSEVLKAAERGVQVRVLLDGSWYNLEGAEGNVAIAALLNQEAKVHGLDLEARVCSAYHEFSTIHNKGAIIDDLSLVSSINWGPTAFQENREVAVAIRSSEVASFFARSFSEDWQNDTIAPVIRLPAMLYDFIEGQRMVIDASNSSDNAAITWTAWDIGDDGSIDWRGLILVCSLPPGGHMIRLTISDSSGNCATALVWAEVRPMATGGPGTPWELLLAIIPIAIIWKGLKRVKRR
jgi:cardiolipin synthase